ncbi:MAG: MBL fold metallo-hydrolase [Chloroflexi bacterium]|nr:MBL fold metallo-hydrolase [Chloroflexota bacterium]
MKPEAPSIHILSDGIIKIDGGSIFGQVPKTLWEQKTKPDRWNRVSLGLNCLLVRTAYGNILVDTGVGSKETGKTREAYGLTSSKLGRGLKEEGLAAKDISGVILTHLHFDHSGGCTKIDRSGNAIPAFPKATYYVQQACWDEANNPNERAEVSHHPEDFSCLQDVGQLTLLDGDTEIFPGVWVRETGGHCRGHQVIQLTCGGEKVMFLGDMVPTPHHLDLPYITAFDQHPEETLEQKRELLAQAAKEGWLVIFGHGNGERAGYLERRDGAIILRPVNL